MSANDIQELTHLLAIVPILYPRGDAWLRRRLDDVVDGSARCLVLPWDGRIAAAAILTPKAPTVTKISTFFVAEWARRRGVGARLAGSVLDDLRQHGSVESYVTVAHHVAAPLESLLGPRGFVRTAVEPDRYGPGRHEVILTHLAD